MPAWFIIAPAKMKNGTARSGNDSVEADHALDEDVDRQAAGDGRS